VALRTVSAPPEIQFMLLARGTVMWAPPAVSPTSAMFWPSVLAGQLPLRSVLCRTVSGGTVLDHGLEICASEI
jgi:hypothetical protein